MTPSPPPPTARPSRRAKTEHKFINPTREHKHAKQQFKKIVIPPHDRTESLTPQHGHSNKETLQTHSLDREQECEGENGRAREVNHHSPSNQASAVQDADPDLFEHDTSDHDAVVNVTVCACQTGTHHLSIIEPY
ncbi:hypothetical protein PAXRUDRAFT_144013 [Paxillus rubicundulus Ve08.2h10]|uniref:Uncharacterized protein n=1 Tax=Paxillus rubicundulus Ve08.2h10 TaxID=930991 RepID=A0A0D0DW15_9AGAM|nr:hypothetical protein PAXRUDRAFT_144013 [Paxillus rubicundulus Ve08.2h10]